MSQYKLLGYESFLECLGLDYYKYFLLNGFSAGPIISLHAQLGSKMSLDPNE